MSTIIRSFAPLALVLGSLAALGCVQPENDLPETATAIDDAEDVDTAEQADVAAVDYFRIQSEQVRPDGTTLCLEPLDNVSGAPVLQKACNNNPLSDNNRQAFYKHPILGYRIAYALHDKNDFTELCIHMAGVANFTNGVAAVLYKCDGTRPSQVFWASTPDAAGYTGLMPGHSHRCLSVFGGASSDLALIYQHDLYQNTGNCPALSQRWQLKTANGVFAWAQVAPEAWPIPYYCQGTGCP